MDTETLGRLLRYDPETGLLFWKYRELDLFKSTPRRPREVTAPQWNSRCAGKQAFTYTNSHGYLSGIIFHVSYTAHRVAWALHHGEWPSYDIDHINGIRSDNKISNLRVVNPSENAKNQRLPKNNTSGRIGVSKTRNNNWQASIKVNRKVMHLGTFKDFTAACDARLAAEEKLKFHPNHGSL